MELTDNIAKGRQVIEGYGDGTFRVGGTVHRGSVLVFADRTLAWEVSNMNELSAESLAAVGQAEPTVEVLLLGCGAKRRPPAQPAPAGSPFSGSSFGALSSPPAA